MVGFIICMSVLFILIVTLVWILIYQRKVGKELTKEMKENAKDIELIKK